MQISVGSRQIFNQWQRQQHNFQQFVVNLANQEIMSFDKFQQLAKDAFRIGVHTVIKQLIYAKKPLHLKILLNQVYLEMVTYDHVGRHFEKELELNGLVALDELQVNTVN